MDQEIKTLLEQLITAQLIVRSRSIRTAWLSLESDKYGGEIPTDRIPNDTHFIDLAASEVSAFREHVVKKLSEARKPA